MNLLYPEQINDPSIRTMREELAELLVSTAELTIGMIQKNHSIGQVLVARTAQMEKDAKKHHEDAMTAQAEAKEEILLKQEDAKEEIILHQEEANENVLSEINGLRGEVKVLVEALEVAKLTKDAEKIKRAQQAVEAKERELTEANRQIEAIKRKFVLERKENIEKGERISVLEKELAKYQDPSSVPKPTARLTSIPLNRPQNVPSGKREQVAEMDFYKRHDHSTLKQASEGRRKKCSFLSGR